MDKESRVRLTEANLRLISERDEARELVRRMHERFSVYPYMRGCDEPDCPDGGCVEARLRDEAESRLRAWEQEAK